MAVASALLVAGVVIYGQARMRQEVVFDQAWWGYLPLVAMAYGSLLLLAVAIVEMRYRHARTGFMTLRAKTLDDLVNYLTEEQERERASISVRLHDDVGALLTALKLEWEAQPGGNDDTRQRVGNLFDRLYSEVRALSAVLYPRLIGTMGLRGALDELVNRFENTRPRMHLVAPVDFSGLGPDKSLCALRIIQDGMVNAGRHAGAGQVWVNLERVDNTLQGTVDDDGKGWGGTREEEGMGITLMRERVRKLGGQFERQSSPLGGARLFFRLPWTSRKTEVFE